jgi:hypothetical protein
VLTFTVPANTGRETQRIAGRRDFAGLVAHIDASRRDLAAYHPHRVRPSLRNVNGIREVLDQQVAENSPR